ncbi:FtsX-like permease family protein [Pseudoalteromonas sp. MMG012]|uniref:FtsX-like permease family protein n=1 Tax=Pseudoalteromonas sp. MMG012 TaxID=2822686 RepID=UPI001B39CE95|nr:FtsX-like permease family protein [Pseudoalteromonas sp. MMG012]MBQ4850232.1 FtsX-like permease family protein [Pseudoalteromonas sp. MMG012]
MVEFKLILLTYWGFYRRHFGLLVLFLVGLSLGSALLTAIQGLNFEAAKRYQSTTAMINHPISHFIRPILGQNYLPFALWEQLRAKGVTSAQPVLEGTIKTQAGQLLRIKGVNLLQWLNKTSAAQNVTAPLSRSQTAAMPMSFLNTLYLDPTMIIRLGLDPDNPVLIFENAEQSMPVIAMEGLGKSGLVDIHVADTLLQANGQTSYFEVTNDTADPQLALSIIKALTSTVGRVESVEEQAFDGLSQAFFLNLKALALLGYVVGAFLSFNAIKLAYTSRQTLQQQLFILGCSMKMLLKALIVELIALSFIAAIFGAVLGSVLANLLVLDVSSTLQSLYKLDRALVVSFDWWLVLFAFILNGVVLFGFVLMQVRHRHLKCVWLRFTAVFVTVFITGYYYFFAVTEVEALMLCVGVLMLFFIVTPITIKSVFVVNWPTKNVVLLWLRADSSNQLSALSSSVLAMLMAVGAAISMQIMVGSFSDALDKHLTKRLSADLYIRVEDKLDELKNTLAQRQDIERVGVYWHAPVEVIKNTGEPNHIYSAKLMSFGQSSEYYSHLNLLGDKSVTPRHFRVESSYHGCLINEPGLLKYQFSVGDKVIIQQQNRYLKCVITGAFYDYGEQALAFVSTTDAMLSSTIRFQQYGVSLWLEDAKSASGIRDELMTLHALDSSQIIENRQFKAFAKRLFNSTFTVTSALNFFIILIALFGMWVSFLTLGRQQLEPITVLQRLGVSNRTLLGAKLLQTGLIIGATLGLAVPLGVLLGWVLLNYVMPIAFGWSMALTIDWSVLTTFIVSIFIAALVFSAIPLRKVLIRNTPSEHMHL